MIDRVAGLLDLIDLFLGPVFGRIAHGMAAIAIGLHLKNVRPAAFARALHGPGRRIAHRQHIHAVDLLARNAEAGPALIQLGRRGRPLDRGAHGVLVVLNDVDGRQLPQLGHVEALIDLALVGRAVTEIDEGHRIVAPVLARERQTRAQRHLRPDDAVPAVKRRRHIEHVHRAALALGRAANAPGQLGHHGIRVHARRQHMAVVAVAGDDLVKALFDVGLYTHRHGFLADIEVTETPDQAHAVQLSGPLLEAADQQHLAVIAQELVLGRLGAIGCLGVCLGGGFRHPASSQTL